MKALILSDSRVGHLNQSYDFCRYMNLVTTKADVKYPVKILKLLSYIFDKFSWYIKIFHCSKNHFEENFSIIVATGSSTYYPALYFSKKLKIPAIALMYPSGYNLNKFKYITATKHDNPPKLKNIIQIPANISFAQTNGIFTPKKKAIGIIMGGNNKVFTMEKEEIKKILHEIKETHKEYEIAITTSPRTSQEIENMIKKIKFDFSIIYSEDKQNPIGDFLYLCEEVFVTIDSTSMISSAISCGKAKICIIPLKTKNKNNKYQKFADNLAQDDYAYFYGNPTKNCKKFNIGQALSEIKL